MSLFTSPIDQIDFPMVDAFLNDHPKESMRLDYKAQISDGLDKTIAAFANTIGGVVILGVEENSATNEPVWPPTNPSVIQHNVPRLMDQLNDLCYLSIYPPVNVQISRLISNPHAPNKVLVVIRVDQSKDAPHAVEKKQQVFYVEKTGNTSRRISPADIDQIERMLDRRRTIEATRDDKVQQATVQAARFLLPEGPYVSLSLIPYFPWRQVCDKESCFASIRHDPWFNGWPARIRIPNGAVGHWTENAMSSVRIGASHLTADGLLSATTLLETNAPSNDFIQLPPCLRFIRETFRAFEGWQRSFIIDRPELWRIVLEFNSVGKYKLYAGKTSSAHPCLVDGFKVIRNESLTSILSNRLPIVTDMLHEVMYNFDCDKQERLGEHLTEFFGGV
ncbi:MAG: ATP-binding protein [Zavarzinella sp.]|nr:ATP-binding protein [Zavarzinella sp.]